MAKDNDSKISTISSTPHGKVAVANEVIAIIAGLSATEVEGVRSMAGNITNELISRIGINNLSKGVTVSVENNTVTVNIAIILEYDFSIPEVSAKVQERVKNTIESMTGLKVKEVNIKVEGVDVPQ